MGAPDTGEPRAAGVWTLAGGRLIIAEPGGPATVLVPTEQVRLLAVDLPLASRAQRFAALPFAIEDRIAEPVETVHLALGAEIAPKSYLVAVVRHDVMAAWVAIAEEAGLGHAAIVPDALALPRPAEGAWAVELAGDRAVVRTGDGTGFAVPASLLLAAWHAAERPAATGYGAPLPSEMTSGTDAIAPEGLAARLLAPALDLCQGLYAHRRAPLPRIWRRLGWVVAIGVVAHATIATADTLMLRHIADQREADARAIAAVAAPGVNLGNDLVASITDLLPTGRSVAPDNFVPLVIRISNALGPLTGSLNVRGMRYEGNMLTLDLDGGDAGLVARIDAALRASRVGGTVTRSPDGSIRVTASAA